MRHRKGRWTAVVYVIPALIVYTLFIVLPGLHTVYLSFFDWNGLAAAKFVGLQNFAALITDPILLRALRNAFVLLIFFTALPIALALLVTAFIGPRPRRGLTAFRAIYFVPQAVPLLAIGIIWRWMYLAGGPISQLGSLIGLPGPKEGWIGNLATALPSLGLVGTWVLYGVCLTLFLTGVQKIDGSLYEAVKLDGGGPWWEFRAVTLPSLRREIALSASLTGVAALASFDLIYITTLGGPGNATVVPGLLVYRLAFTNGEIGAAAALATGLTIITGLYVLIVSRLDSKA